MNIYWKLTSLCLFLVLFTAGTFFYFVNIEAQKVLKAQILDEISQQSVNSMHNIERFIYERISDITSLSQNTILKNPNATPQEINIYLKKLHNLNELYYSFSFFDSKRLRLADSKNLEVGKIHSFKNYWVDLSQNKDIVIDISQSVSAKSNVLHFASKVKNNENKLQGVIVSRVLIDKLYEVFEEVPYNKHIQKNLMIDLIDKEGKLLYSNHQPQKVLSYIYKDLNILKDSTNSFKLLETDKKLYFYVKEQGYLSYRGNQWTLIVSVDTHKAYTPLIEIRNRLIFLFVPVIIASIMIGLFLANRLARPIIKLAKAAQELGNENWNVNIQVNTHDELKILGKELHKMGVKMKNKIQEQAILNDNLSQKFQEIQEQKKFIEYQNRDIKEKNKRITESITYAKRIQNAMLPENDDLIQNFEDFFIYYQPKDIVSGDFYWFDVIPVRDKKYFVMAVADCTGHGVPGAILAMLGSNLLSNLVTYQKNINPQKILYLLDKYIKDELNQENTNSGVHQDGMEIAICTIDLDTLKMQFSGGGRPIYIARQNELLELKGDKISIGGIGYNRKNIYNDDYFQISLHNFELQKNDKIYLFTDGYKDQFGGMQNTKIGSRRFKENIIKSQNYFAGQQKNYLEYFFNDWKEDNEQIDDVLVVSITI